MASARVRAGAICACAHGDAVTAERDRMHAAADHLLASALDLALPLSDGITDQLATAIGLLGAAAIRLCRRSADPAEALDIVMHGFAGARAIIAARRGPAPPRRAS